MLGQEAHLNEKDGHVHESMERGMTAVDGSFLRLLFPRSPQDPGIPSWQLVDPKMFIDVHETP